MISDSSPSCCVDYMNEESLNQEKVFKCKNRSDFSQDDAKILSNDKINRQLFESEVLLMNALQNIKFNEKIQNSNHFFLTKLNDLKSIIYITKDSGMNYCSDRKEVIHLPESILSTKTNSEIIPEIIESRKLKFYKIFEEFRQLMGLVNKKTEKSISKFSEILNIELSEVQRQMEIDLQVINSHENVTNITRELFETLKIKRKTNYKHNKSLIENFNKNILLAESNRIISIQKLVTKSSMELSNIGHLPPTEIRHLINAILLEINLSIIENKKVFSDMTTKLHIHRIYEERKCQIYCKNIHLKWQHTVLNNGIDLIKNKIEKEEIKVPESIKYCMENIKNVVSSLSIKIENILMEIKNEMHPEISNESLIEKWNCSLTAVKNEFDKNCETSIKACYQKIEDVNQLYLNDRYFLKVEILNRRILDDEMECSKIIENSCLPLLGKFHSSFELFLFEIEVLLENTQLKLELIIRKIENFLKNVWELWKTHESDLKKTEETIFQKFNNTFILHQEQNLNVENEFNGMIDKMRQDPNEQVLKESLKKCINLLDKIKTSYSHFYNQQVQIIKKYPSQADNDVKFFENHISNYFNNYRLIQDNYNSEKEENTDCSIKISDRDILGINHVTSIKLLEISNSQLFDIVKSVENNFLQFIKKWYGIVSVNTNKIVTVKIDELNSELKFRYHLHEPRYKRIEYDIHNVRSAELLIHFERVSKQCKGIESALNSIMHDYTILDKDIQLKQEKFKENLASDELTFLNITNNLKLLNMKKMLEDRISEYMDNIRVSLRNFRKNIEKKLQNLRQSNADFVRSFKLFSNGGNFCIEEIEEFTKKIEKINKKIDDVEGEIMSNLEIVEKQQHDSLTQCQNVFEEKFKYHIVDINFMQKINRAFYNTQVKIKAEVLNSNSQSQIIYDNLKYLKTIFIKQSTSKSEKISTIMENILSLFTCIHDRSFYLDCIKTQLDPTLKSCFPENVEGINLNKVKFSAITTISKGGRQPNEDAGIKIVKNILQFQSDFLQNETSKPRKDSLIGLITDFKNADKEIKIKYSKAKDKTPLLDHKSNFQNGHNSRSTSLISESFASGPKVLYEKSKLVNKNQRFEKKYLAFGDDSSESCPTFLNKIRTICKDILDGILYSAELYYRNKGVRKVTNLTLQDSFDQAAEDIIFKLKFYFQQAEEYHNECLQEFKKQLLELENVINLFPRIMYSSLLENIICECNHSLENENKVQLKNFKMLFEHKQKNYLELRSDYGQPSKSEELNFININEESRQSNEFEEIINSFRNNNTLIYSIGRKFVNSIFNATEQLLLLVDNILTINDIQIPEGKLELNNTNVLIRTHMKIQPENIIVSENDTSFNKITWTSNDMNDILVSDSSNLTENDDTTLKCLISAKHTSCHDSIMNERTTVIKDFKVFYFEKLDYNKNMKEDRLKELTNYQKFWKESIENLRKFHVI